MLGDANLMLFDSNLMRCDASSMLFGAKYCRNRVPHLNTHERAGLRCWTGGGMRAAGRRGQLPAAARQARHRGRAGRSNAGAFGSLLVDGSELDITLRRAAVDGRPHNSMYWRRMAAVSGSSAAAGAAASALSAGSLEP